MSLFNPRSIVFGGRITSNRCENECPLTVEGECSLDYEITNGGVGALGYGEYFMVTSGFIYADSIVAPTEEKSFGHGSYYGTSRRTQRLITLTGHIFANDRCGFEGGFKQLNNLWKIGGGGSLCERGFFRMEWQGNCLENPESYDGDACGVIKEFDCENPPIFDTYYCFARVIGVQVDFQDCNFSRVPYTITLEVKDTLMYRGETQEDCILEGRYLGIMPPCITYDDCCQPSQCETVEDCVCYSGTQMVTVDPCNTDDPMPACYTVSWSGEECPLESDPLHQPSGIATCPAHVHGDVMGCGLTIKNITTGVAIKLIDSFCLRKDDVLQICVDGRVELNGANLNGVLEEGYDVPPTLIGGENEFVIYDSTNPDIHGRMLQLCIKRNEII